MGGASQALDSSLEGVAASRAVDISDPRASVTPASEVPATLSATPSSRMTGEAAEKVRSPEEPLQEWLVDTQRELAPKMRCRFEGVGWRGSLDLGDRVLGQDGSELAANGEMLRGRAVAALDGTSWLQVEGGLYLPMSVQGSTVVWPARELSPRHPSPNPPAPADGQNRRAQNAVALDYVKSPTKICGRYWAELTGQQRADAQICGYTQATWDSDEANAEIEDLYWDQIPRHQREALLRLGNTKESWDEDDDGEAGAR